MRRPPHFMPPHFLPIMATVLGIALFSIMDAFMKRASIASGVYSALLLRSVLAGGTVALIWRARGGRVPAGPVLRLHALRGVVCAVMAASFFYGLVRTPMAQGMALSFIAPLIALYLAAVVLGEQIRREAIIAALFGLAGVIVIAADRIGGATIEGEAAKGIAAVLASALLYAWNLVLQRQQAQVASPWEVVTFQNLFVGLALLPLAPLLWHMPDLGAVRDVAGGAALATGALLLLSWAYARAEAQVLVPIEYTAFFWAALMGWLWFDEAVTPATLAGLALILIGCWIAARGPRAAVAA